MRWEALECGIPAGKNHLARAGVADQRMS
jgi:hypothetical protein